MIKLVKSQEPSVLSVNKVQWTDDYKKAKEDKADNLDELTYRYRHPDIKKQLVDETHGKCAYCESKIRHVYPGDVEHIKPKSKHEDKIFEWDNLTLGCSECNRRKTATDDDDVINPYQTDPSDHLMALGAMIFPKPGDLVGKLAYELFELNRFDLFEQRKDRIEYLQRLIDEWSTASNPTYKKLLEKKIAAEKDESKEYAMVSRSFIDLCRKVVTSRARSSKLT